MAAVLSMLQRRILWAVALRVLAGRAPDRPALLDECDRTLAREPVSVRWLVRLFLGFVRMAARLSYGCPFEELDGESQDAFLARLQMSGLRPLRSGFWGLRTLVLIAYYGRPEAGAALGWSPVADGNAVLRRLRP